MSNSTGNTNRCRISKCTLSYTIHKHSDMFRSCSRHSQAVSRARGIYKTQVDYQTLKFQSLKIVDIIRFVADLKHWSLQRIVAVLNSSRTASAVMAGHWPCQGGRKTRNTLINIASRPTRSTSGHMHLPDCSMITISVVNYFSSPQLLHQNTRIVFLIRFQLLGCSFFLQSIFR